MNKTKVDDMLIEMITPKVKEIEEKFSKGEGLSQDDINTLLLKSQYNHINHLDVKLDETVASVKELENKFVGLENKFELLRNDMYAKFDKLESDMYAKFSKLESDIEVTIQKALNKNMMLLIVAMGFFLTLSKLIDKF